MNALISKATSSITSTSNSSHDHQLLRGNNSNKWRILVSYWILGLCNNYGYVVMLSAAHDILDTTHGDNNSTITQDFANDTPQFYPRKCNTLSTGAILLADILPAFAIKLIAPFLPFVVHFRLALVVLFGAAGFILVSLEIVWVAIVGVALTSLASGLGEVTLLAYTSKYESNAISTWSSGTGGAGILGAASYIGLSSVLTPKQTLLSMLIVPVLMAVTFWFILPHDNLFFYKPQSIGTSQRNICDYTASNDLATQTPEASMKFIEKLRSLPKLLKYMFPLASVYFLEYFINQGLYELIDYQNFVLDQKSQYRWFQLIYQIGVFISRSSVNIVHIRHLNWLSFFQLVNVILLLTDVIYFYIPSIWIVFVLILWEGLLGGGAYVNTYYKMTKEIPSEKLQFSLGFTSISDSIGIGLAGVAAFPVHNAICALSGRPKY